MDQIVIFKLGNEEYGVDIMEVVEIVLYQEIRQVPDAPNYIEGIVNLRGDILPVYNLRTRFNMDKQLADDSTKIIVIRTERMNIGFIVDDVTEILSMSKENIDNAPNMINEMAESKYIRGVAKYEERMIVILDVNELVTKKDTTIINKIIEKQDIGAA